MFLSRFACGMVLVAVALGCDSQPKLSQISGNVTFKGKPVPAGYVSFSPNLDAGTEGHVRVFMVENGVYDSAKASEPGIPPGTYTIEIAGFDGVRIPMYFQGKQIFNPVKDKHVVPEGITTKDFEVPESAGQNVKITPTADY